MWWKTPRLQPAPKVLPNHKGALEHSEFVRSAIKQLVDAGAVRPVSHCPRVVNPLSAVPKPRQPGKFRLIMDLRYVNDFVYCPKCKFEKVGDLNQIWQTGDLLISLDLTNSYWQLRMREDALEYLGFEWEGQYYVFTVLPFGLVSAPWGFSELMRGLSAFLRNHGLRLINYLDDFLFLLGSNPARAAELRDIVVRAFQQAGVAVNAEKSVLSPCLSTRCLGYMVNSGSGTFSVPNDRWEALQAAVGAALAGPKVPARTLARAVGHVASLYLVTRGLGRLFTRECGKLLPDRYGWHECVVITPEARSELEFWLHLPQDELVVPIRLCVDVSVLELSTDASDHAWSGVLRSPRGPVEVARSFLSRAQRVTSSANRELAAIYYSLESFGDELRGKEVHVCTDSMNARRIVETGSRKSYLQEWALRIFWWCRRRDVRLRLSWVPREWNEVADFFSKFNDGSDWKLHPAWFRALDKKWGPHTVDRFASDRNTHLSRFNSLFRCPGSEAVNAFSVSWRGENNWCNPPFSLVGRVLAFMQQQGTEGTVVIPVWRSAVWWPTVCPQPGRFAQFVVGVVVLPHQQSDLFLPGQSTSNEYGVGTPQWGVWALRVSFVKGWRWRNPIPNPEM